MARKTKYRPRAADKARRHHDRFPYEPRRVGNRVVLPAELQKLHRLLLRDTVIETTRT
jgi:hypothetical protein